MLSNYGEAQGAESRSDFIHKMGIVLKELEECRSGLKIIQKRRMRKPDGALEAAFKETEELIAITAKGISTARRKSEK
ncbi:MAG: four helix bundle protein [Bacteroidetes bacterium]|nr:four helix bundle protein [Bacteroidota bacterium]